MHPPVSFIDRHTEIIQLPWLMREKTFVLIVNCEHDNGSVNGLKNIFKQII
jgi:hypothetical protein